MRKKRKKDSIERMCICKFSTVSTDGFRVKHRVWQDPENPEVFWHTETRLTDNPAMIFGFYEGNYIPVVHETN